MTKRVTKRAIPLLLALLFAVTTAWAAEKVTTDGTNGKSPVKVQTLDFMDSGYGQPGPNSEIRISATIRNTSAKEDLKNVVFKLQLKNLAGDVVEEWTKNISVLKKGAIVQFQPDAVYYNYTHNNLQGAVEVQHDALEEQ